MTSVAKVRNGRVFSLDGKSAAALMPEDSFEEISPNQSQIPYLGILETTARYVTFLPDRYCRLSQRFDGSPSEYTKR